MTRLIELLVMLDVPSPWEFILKIINWLKDIIQSPAVKGFLVIIGIIAALIIAWLLSRFTRWVKQVLGNLATPSGFIFFILALIAFIVILFKYNII